jgi:hypothetical protein
LSPQDAQAREWLARAERETGKKLIPKQPTLAVDPAMWRKAQETIRLREEEEAKGRIPGAPPVVSTKELWDLEEGKSKEKGSA